MLYKGFYHNFFFKRSASGPPAQQLILALLLSVENQDLNYDAKGQRCTGVDFKQDF